MRLTTTTLVVVASYASRVAAFSPLGDRSFASPSTALRAGYLDDLAGPGPASGGGGGGSGPASYLDAMSGGGAPAPAVPAFVPPPAAGGTGTASYLDAMSAPAGGSPAPASYAPPPPVEYAAPPTEPAAAPPPVEYAAPQPAAAVGDVVAVQDERGNKWYRGTISAARTINIYSVSYPDGDEDINLPEDALRAQDGASPLGVGTPVEVLSWEDRFGPFAEQE